MADYAQRMMDLLSGCECAHGTHGKLDTERGVLKKGIHSSARTPREPPTLEHWIKHIEGKRALGIIPIREDNTCWWGCLDIDVYDDLHHAILVQQCEKAHYPVVITRSKSGGAHCFLFVDKPIPAKDMQSKIQKMAIVLGRGESEIFPKSATVEWEKGDLSPWLNMPYFDANRTERFCITAEGRQLALGEFLDYAESRKIKADDFYEVGSEVHIDEIEDLSEGPPCLRVLCTQGFPNGTRNNGLFGLGTLAKKKFPDEWESKLEDWNVRFMDPPLESSEVQLVIKSLKKKDYHYRCGDSPLRNFCEKRKCVKMKYGVGGGAAHALLASVSMLDTEPPLYYVKLSEPGPTGKDTVICGADAMTSQRIFQTAALAQTQILLPTVKQNEWEAAVSGVLEKVLVIEAPEEVGLWGQLRLHLQKFCTDRHRAEVKEDMLRGKPFYEEDTDRYCFRMVDAMEHLDRVKFKIRSNELWTQLKSWGGGKEVIKLNGQTTNYWWLPASVFSVQTEPHKITGITEIPI